MTIQSQLDQVLALAEKATPGGWYYVHGHGWCCKGGPTNAPYAIPVIRDATEYDGPPSDDERFLRAAVNFLREHGPAIRAAVGGEAVADVAAARRERDEALEAQEYAELELAYLANEMIFNGNSIGWTASKADKYKAALGRAWDAVQDVGGKCDGNTALADAIRQQLIASPPTTVDVGPNDFLDGMIAALGCLWLGFGYGPGTAEYDEVLNSAGRAKVLERAKTMHPEDIANAGLAALIGKEA